jgi:hypothetical protein
MNLMTFIGFYFLFNNLFQFFIIAAWGKVKTNKNRIKLIIWLVLGGSSGNFHISLSLYTKASFVVVLF